MKLQLTFATTEQANLFLLKTDETDLSNIPIGLINMALKAEGLVSCVAVGEPILFHVKTDDGWTTEIVADPVSRIQAGEILEPAEAPIKMLGWAQNRIANRYAPFVANPYLATVEAQRSVEVIVMDSGIRKDHVEFEGVQIEDLFTLPDFTDTEDTLGHGTAIASLVAGKTLGVNKNATLKIVKVSDATRKPSISELGDLIDQVYEYRQTKLDVPMVVNMSWRIPASEYINAKITKLIDAGMMVVAAAGNTLTNIDEVTPAGLAGVFTVAGSTSDDHEFAEVYGVNKKIDLYAPAKDVDVAGFNAVDEYTLNTGSSFSAALASGVASALFGINKIAPMAQEVKDVMIADSTYNALILNDKVSQTENRLLHRPDTNSLPDNNIQYLGTNTLGGTADMKVDVKMLMPVNVLSQIEKEDLVFSLQFGDAEMATILQNSVVSDDGVVGIRITPGTQLAPGENVKQMWFTVTLHCPGITFVSPKIYFFLVTPDAVSSDIKPMLDELSASSSFTFLEEVDQESVQGKGIKS
jgi:hypothetical protein